MGFLGFGKSKESSQPNVQTIPSPELPAFSTDLPSIDGSSMQGASSDTDLPPMPSIPEDMHGLSQLPSFESPAGVMPSSPDSKSLSFNVPTLDFSMPLTDDEEAKKGTALESLEVPIPPEPSLRIAPSEIASETEPVTAEELNKLFIGDDWKEPESNSFDYTEEKIDEPKPEDFHGAELPQFEDNPMSAPQAPLDRIDRPETSHRPVELFIRGKAYSRVFRELEEMSSSLSSLDSRSNAYEEILKREDQVLLSAKEQMEYLYKKVNSIDRKIFAQ